MKKILLLLLISSIFMSIFTLTINGEETTTSTVLFAADTMQILSQTGDTKVTEMGTLAQLMTLLLVAEDIEKGKFTLLDIVTVSDAASAKSLQKGCTVWLRSGEKITVNELVKAVAISSANDACVALAEFCSGSEADFVARMNVKAGDLGLFSTSFFSCTGQLEDTSTAADIAVIASKLLFYDFFDNIWTQWIAYIREGTEKAAQLINTNRLVRTYKGYKGFKMCKTKTGKYNMVTAAKQNNMCIVSVVLLEKSEEVINEHSKSLLDSGFKSFERVIPMIDLSRLKPIKVAHGMEKEVAVVATEFPDCIIQKEKKGNIRYLYTIMEQVTASVTKGQIVGEICIIMGENVISRCDIVAASDVLELTFLKSLELMFKSLICA